MVKWRGSWQQTRLTSSDVRVIIWVLVIQALARGYDYSTGVESVGPTVANIPLWVWGSSFIVGGLLLGSGVTFKIHMLVWLGHAWLFIFHLALAVESFLDALDNGFDGIRGATVYLLTTTVHAFFMVRTGIRPIIKSDSLVPEEGIYRPEEGG